MYRAFRNNQDINLARLTKPEIQSLKQQSGFTCPYCKDPVQLKVGSKKRPHFAHMRPCPYQYHENESSEHLLAKNLLAGWLQDQGVAAELEKPLRHIGRIADLYFEYQNQKYAFEFQKSAISESLFQERIRAYEAGGIQVFWIFIGEFTKKPHTYRINRTMGLNRKLPMMHLKVERELLTMFSHIVWVSTKEIQAHEEARYLKHLTIDDLLATPDSKPATSDWLKIKQEFRQQKWSLYMRGEQELQRFCYQYRSNISLLPAEVGWPIHGTGFRKHIFIWQAHALFAIMKQPPGDYFTLTGLIRKMKIPVSQEAVPELKDYLELLGKFGILGKEGNYYVYVKAPQFYDRLERALLGDARLASTALWHGESSKRQVG